MRNLVIDIGNTLQKCAAFEGDTLLWCEKSACFTRDDWQKILQANSFDHAIVSAVGKCDEEIMHFIAARVPLFHFSQKLRLPVSLSYETPSTLGSDRIAAVSGARALYPDENVLVVQAGTCLVCDFLSADGRHLGGSIAPGLHMSFDALHRCTANLPLVEPEPIADFIGNSTKTSILNGVVNSIVDAINATILRYKEKFGKIRVILTGGDATYLENSIKNTIFATPNLVLIGLEKILEINVKNE